MKAAKEEHREANDVRSNTLKVLSKSQQHKSAVIEDSSGNILTKSRAVLNQQTEYCSDLYNYELHPDTSLLQSNQTRSQEAESLPVLKEEVEEAVRNPKAGKSPGVDNIPSELLKNNNNKKNDNNDNNNNNNNNNNKYIVSELDLRESLGKQVVLRLDLN